MINADPFDLARFVEAQHSAYDTACRELEEGRKRSHWIWFVFPQLKGLGSSANAQFYGIASLAEAQAYLAHPLLGRRLEHVTRLMCESAHSPHDVLGSPDDLKFWSSMTLFSRAAGSDSLFRRAIDTLYGGEEDALTVALLAGQLSNG